ncbi:MAG: cupin domain-containing protein [Chloroflexota bacterium]
MTTNEPADGSIQARVNSIGERVRSLRSSKSLGVRELARKVGITPSMLSQIERGMVRPSVGTLFRLADGLGITTDAFFRDDEPSFPSPLVRPDDRARMELSDGVTWERLTPGDEHDFEFMRTEYLPGAASAPELLRHAGRDYGILMEGRLEITVGFTTYHLTPGDSIAFDASMPHRLYNPGPGVASTIWVVLERNAVG